MVTTLREADPQPTAEVAKKHRVSDQTIYAWRKRFGTLEPADVKRLRQLAHENGRLKDGRRPVAIGPKKAGRSAGHTDAYEPDTVSSAI